MVIFISFYFYGLKGCDLKTKNSAIPEYIALLRANQIARTTSDFKIDKSRNELLNDPSDGPSVL